MGLSAGARTREARLAVDDLDILQMHNRHGGEVARREKCPHVMMVCACSTDERIFCATMVCKKCEKTLKKVAPPDPFVRRC